MARSNKPVVWGLFALGGTIAAFVLPALVVITQLATYEGYRPAGLSYETMHAFAGNWLGKLILFGVIVPVFWHTAHRLRTVLYSLGLRADLAVAVVGYGLAAIGTILTIQSLLGI
jgi:fumarate reductase subunit D